MVPAAPPVFSITTVWPSSGRICSARKRASVSVAPPAGNGTIMAIGRVGYSCAAAIPSDAATPKRPTTIAAETFSNPRIPPPPGTSHAAHVDFVADPNPGFGHPPRDRFCETVRRSGLADRLAPPLLGFLRVAPDRVGLVEHADRPMLF